MHALLFVAAFAAHDAPETVSVTFGMNEPFAGQVCTSKLDATMSFSGDARSLAVFGSKRGIDLQKTRTVLEVERGKVKKEKLHVDKSVTFVVNNGAKSDVVDPRNGRTYILTAQADPTADFVVTHEDGTPASPTEIESIRTNVDRRAPDLLGGRTMKLKEKLVFGADDVAKYFPLDLDEMRGFEMSLGAVENGGADARVDVKFLFDVKHPSLGAQVKAWATLHTTVDQRRSTMSVEGPIHVALPPMGTSAKSGGLTGVVEANGVDDCTSPAPAER